MKTRALIFILKLLIINILIAAFFMVSVGACAQYVKNYLYLIPDIFIYWCFGIIITIVLVISFPFYSACVLLIFFILLWNKDKILPTRYHVIAIYVISALLNIFLLFWGCSAMSV